MELWRLGDLIKGICTFTSEKAIVIGLCLTLGIESTPPGHAKTSQPHLEQVIRAVSMLEPLRHSNFVSGAASVVSLGDLGFTLSAVGPTAHETVTNREAWAPRRRALIGGTNQRTIRTVVQKHERRVGLVHPLA